MPVVLTHARTFCFKSLSLSLSLSLSAGAGRAGQSPRKDYQALSLTSSGRVLDFLCDQLVSQKHISHLFAPVMAAAALRRSAKTTPSRSSNQSWSPNSGQVTEDRSRHPALVLVSEHEQQSSASNLALPQQQDHQTGIQTPSASSSLDQPQWIGPVLS